MTLRFCYKPLADRIVMTVKTPDGERSFWVTRRQCIALLNACRPISPHEENPQIRSGVGAVKAKGTSSKTDVSCPVLGRMGLRRTAKGLGLTFAVAGKAVFKMTIGASDQIAVYRNLTSLASQAQWDIESALQRQTSKEMLRRVN